MQFEQESVRVETIFSNFVCALLIHSWNEKISWTMQIISLSLSLVLSPSLSSSSSSSSSDYNEYHRSYFKNFPFSSPLNSDWIISKRRNEKATKYVRVLIMRGSIRRVRHLKPLIYQIPKQYEELSKSH